MSPSPEVCAQVGVVVGVVVVQQHYYNQREEDATFVKLIRLPSEGFHLFTPFTHYLSTVFLCLRTDTFFVPPSPLRETPLLLPFGVAGTCLCLVYKSSENFKPQKSAEKTFRTSSSSSRAVPNLFLFRLRPTYFWILSTQAVDLFRVFVFSFSGFIFFLLVFLVFVFLCFLSVLFAHLA